MQPVHGTPLDPFAEGWQTQFVELDERVTTSAAPHMPGRVPISGLGGISLTKAEIARDSV